MSMELRLLSDRRLSTIGEWQNAIAAEAFPLQLSDETSLDAVKGFCHRLAVVMSLAPGRGYGFPVPASVRDLLIGDDKNYF